MSETIDHEGTRNLVCPWCGYEDLDSWEYHHNSGDDMCKNCGKPFGYERDVSVSYTTWKPGVKV
ncbi:hypothetical protein V7O61_08330 [Methanolobus sp. WCC1]|uniref:Uncharacterized protein n=1 Tax=Methanolobus tindarius DSM 2278 TaxID=1090322 RepID=W9DUN9_METTI|nr:hypothetical protein [Methanolobus tindarius]ETA67402.1 hypothetical protein MettiDRAFT_0826 [Methanolobus tindarius DSM 2278]